LGKSGGFVGQILGTILTIVGLLVPGGPSWWVIAAGVAMSAAGSYFSQQALNKSLDIDRDFSRSGHLVNTRAVDAVIPIIYGQMRVGGNQVFVTTTGATNESTLYIDDKAHDDAFYDGNVALESAVGTHTQAVNATLQAAYPSWDDAMHGTAYAYVQITYNRDIFQTVPLITMLVKGKKLFDPRDGTTAYSTNPALVIYDLLTNSDYGLGIDAKFIDRLSFYDAANWADTNSITFNGILRTQENALDIIEKCLLNMRGTIVDTDGQYKLKIYKFDPPVMKLNDNDVIDNSFQYNLAPWSGVPNKLKVKYIDVDENYVVSEFDFADEPTVTSDGIERQNELNLIGTADYQQATDLATYYYERQRLNITYSMTVGNRGIALEPGDIFSMTHPLPAWTDQLCRVVEISYNPNYTASVIFVEELAALYDRKLNVLSHTQYSGDFPNPQANSTIGVITVTEETRYESPSSYEARITFTRLKCEFTKPSNEFWDYAEVWISVDGGVNYTHKQDTTGTFYIDPAEEELTYYIKLASVNIHGVREAIADLSATTASVVGSGLTPPDVSNFEVSTTADTINMRWDAVDDIDLIGYEIRDGADWASGIVVAFIKSISYSLVGLVPGGHTFLIKAKDSRGNYSTNAASKTIIIQLPPNYSVQSTYATTAGTFSNTSWWAQASAIDTALAGVGQVLAVTTNGVNTTGSFLCDDFDLSSDLGIGSSVATERFWHEYEIVITGDETLWNSKFVSTAASTANQWNKFPTQTWAAIFAPSVSGGVTMELLHGLSSAVYTTVQNFHIFAHEASARFLKYRVNLTNVSSNVRVLMKPSTLVAAYWTT
jgi:hypothetical protein